MTWVDAVMLGVVALSALFSMVRGFVREVLGVFAWVGV
jgi:membrane protein required for colicin V production